MTAPTAEHTAQEHDHSLLEPFSVRMFGDINFPSEFLATKIQL